MSTLILEKLPTDQGSVEVVYTVTTATLFTLQSGGSVNAIIFLAGTRVAVLKGSNPYFRADALGDYTITIVGKCNRSAVFASVISVSSGGGGSSVNVVDNLTPTGSSSTDALSQNQGVSLSSAIGVLQTEVTLNSNDRHTHPNQPILDATTASFTLGQQTVLTAQSGTNTGDMTDGDVVTAVNTSLGNTLWQSGGGGGATSVVDDLTPSATSSTDALSHNQGILLSGLIDDIQTSTSTFVLNLVEDL